MAGDSFLLLFVCLFAPRAHPRAQGAREELRRLRVFALDLKLRDEKKIETGTGGLCYNISFYSRGSSIRFHYNSSRCGAS